MEKKRLNRRLVIYEIRNVIGNPFVEIFGIFFPVLMLFIITRALRSEFPEAMIAKGNTSVFITMSLIIPMAVVLLGYSANYSQEMEKEIPLRLQLFGYPAKSIFAAKIIAQFAVMTAGLVFYTVVAYASLELEIPRASSALCLIFCLYLSGVIFFILGHAAATLLKKFGPTYAAMMCLYFGLMILCGMMGIKTEQLPRAARQLAKLVPMSYISSDFIDFWTKGTYNFAPLIQAFLFCGAVSGIFLLIVFQRERRINT